MPLKIFVTATNTDIGKTHTTLLLMEEAAKRGLRPLAFKPVETGVTGGVAPDGSRLLEASKRLNPDAASLRLEDIVPYRFELPAAPIVAKGNRYPNKGCMGITSLDMNRNSVKILPNNKGK